MVSFQALQPYLPKRWFPLPERVEHHPTIKRFRSEVKRFKTVHAGRRSFKTEIGKRTVVSACYGTKDEAFFFGAPTRDQAKRIVWPDVKALSFPDLISDYSESELWIKYKTGCELWVLGFDKPERFEGKRWKGGVLTEFPHFKESTWNESIMPALRDTKGWAIIEGVPEGKNHYFKLSEYARTSGDPEWADYQWLSADVMDADEVAKERARLDPRTYRQEYEGSFESYEGRAYPYFERDIHWCAVPILDSLPLIVCCDFNIDPCLWEIGQDNYPIKQLDGKFERGTVIHEEIKQRQTDIWKMCAYAKERLAQHRNRRIIFYGDYSSSSRRDVSAIHSSWEIIRGEFSAWDVDFRMRSNPRILDRVNAFNSRLRSADGSVRVLINPKCAELTEDLEQVDMAMLTEHKSEAKDRTHASDAVGYFMHYEYPVRTQKSEYFGQS